MSSRLGSSSFLPAAILFDRVAGRDRRAKSDATFLHEFEDFRRAFVAVFDRIDACENRAPHSFRGCGVG